MTDRHRLLRTLFAVRILGAFTPLGLLVLGEAVSAEVTPGWENVCPERLSREFPPVKVLWTSPGTGFDIRKEDGAEGDVSVENGKIRIRKTNAKGRITVSAPAFKAQNGKALRFFADVSASAASPDKTHGYLCAHGKNRVVSPEDKIGRQWFAGGGYSYMRRLVNSAPGMTYRKYSHFMPEGEPVTAVIAVEGEPSESVWSNWKDWGQALQKAIIGTDGNRSVRKSSYPPDQERPYPHGYKPPGRVGPAARGPLSRTAPRTRLSGCAGLALKRGTYFGGGVV